MIWWTYAAQAMESLVNLVAPPPPQQAAEDTPSPYDALPDPFVGLWGKDPDVWEELCSLQAEWVALKGSGDPVRLRVMRDMHRRIDRLYPNAA